MSKSKQIPLPLEVSPEPLHIVIGDANRLAYEALMQDVWPDYGAILTGPAGSGKSLLVRYWAQQYHATILNASMHAPFAPATHYVLDDYNEADEQQIFHLLNHCRAQQARLLLTRRDSQKHTAKLADARSRLRALPTLHLHAPDDVLLAQLFTEQLARHQLSAPAQVIDYVISRNERSYAAIIRLGEHICREAVRQRRKMTLPFVKTLLHK